MDWADLRYIVHYREGGYLGSLCDFLFHCGRNFRFRVSWYLHPLHRIRTQWERSKKCQIFCRMGVCRRSCRIPLRPYGKILIWTVLNTLYLPQFLFSLLWFSPPYLPCYVSLEVIKYLGWMHTFWPPTSCSLNYRVALRTGVIKHSVITAGLIRACMPLKASTANPYFSP